MSVRFVLITSAIAIGAVSWLTLSVAGQPSAGQSDEMKPNVVLSRIKESRVKTLVEPDGNNQHQMSMNKPGLTLTFQVELPDGQQLLEVSEPEDFMAKDATGRDLTKTEKNFKGERNHVKLVSAFNKPATRFKMRLALSARSAETFDLRGDVTVTSYGSTEELDVALDTDWMTIDTDLFGDNDVRCKLKQQESFQGNQVPAVVIEPGTVKEAIEKIELVRGGQSISARGTMWNNQHATYSFDGEYHEDYRAKITVRTDVRETPVHLEFNEQDLP